MLVLDIHRWEIFETRAFTLVLSGYSGGLMVRLWDLIVKSGACFAELVGR
jgi:hypothetical protein